MWENAKETQRDGGYMGGASRPQTPPVWQSGPRTKAEFGALVLAQQTLQPADILHFSLGDLPHTQKNGGGG